MTFGEITTEVLRRLREVSDGTEVFWRDTDVHTAINEGYAEISDATEWNEQWERIDLLVNRPYYDARTLLGDEFLVAGPAFNMTTNRWLIPTTTLHLDEGDWQWETRLAEPDRFIIRGLWWIGYWPIRNSEDGRIKQYYIAVPDPMTDDEDVPGFHQSFHYGLVEYALFDLHAQDGEFTLAADSWREYLIYEEKLRRYVQNRASIPLRHGWMGA
jgi:hypothetical protein